MRPFPALLAAATGLRLALLVWGTVQDARSSVKYTDIDYVVFSDAARCIVRPTSDDCRYATGVLGRSLGDPYARDTYRYTPLLALVATANILVHPLCAKLLFALADLVVGTLLYVQLVQRGVERHKASLFVGSIWLLNPIVANISTRGSAESILGLLVLGTLVLFEEERWDWAAALFGLAVHFKLYPVIYGSSLFVAISRHQQQLPRPIRAFLGFNAAHLRFGLVSFASFMLLNVAMFAIWGEPFIEHTFLYHIHRLDHRHNFSLYFYPFYLSAATTSETISVWTWLVRSPLAAFVPQLGLSVGLGFLFGEKDLAFSWFVQTFAFVTFNKVCTSQYFLWYSWFLPLVLPNLHLTRRDSVTLIVVWVASQALWLSQAYRLEMLGQAVYFTLWTTSVVFLLSNCWVLSKVILAYRPAKRRTKLQ